MPPSPPSKFKVYFLLHFSVFLYGLSGIFGKMISLEGTALVWYRMVITLGTLLFFPALFRKVRAIPRKQFVRMMGIGMLLALHWITFFDAIRLSNVTIALSCLASSAFFTSLVEPIVFGRKVQLQEILLGIMVIGGFAFMIEFTGEKYLVGIILGILSAFLYALVAVGNKTAVSKTDGYVITFVEFLGGVLFISVLIPFYQFYSPETKWIPTTQDWAFLVALVLLCTTLAYNLTLIAMKEVSAYTVALTLNLEPLYAIFLAYLIFREDKELHPGVYLGAVMIILSVFLDFWLKGRKKDRNTLDELNKTEEDIT
jgi:drug/metabolite transporter (DMT)-like permease